MTDSQLQIYIKDGLQIPESISACKMNTFKKLVEDTATIKLLSLTYVTSAIAADPNFNNILPPYHLY